MVVEVVENSAGAALASGARISMPSRNTSSATSSTSSVNAANVSRPRSQVWNSLTTSAPISGTRSRSSRGARQPEHAALCRRGRAVATMSTEHVTVVIAV